MIYLDHAATTPMHPKVIQKFAETMTSIYGNPSSVHAVGREARKYLDAARKVFATSIHASPLEILLTSGGTEANNHAIIGGAKMMAKHGNHIVTTNIEHHAVLKTCEQLEREGFRVTYLEADEKGQIHPHQVAKALTKETILVSIMYGNNEVGTLQPIEEIGQLLKNHQALFHTDAVQAYGLIPIDVQQLQVDLLSVSAHKLNGPKGIGFLYMNQDIHISPLIFGGEQERKRRAGTENVPAAVAFQEAVRISQATISENHERFAHFEKIFCEILRREGVSFSLHGENAPRLPHIMNLSFPGMDIESFLVNLDMAGVCASSGSACTAGSLNPSHVLEAMYGKEAQALRNSVRFSFGYNLTNEAIQLAAEKTAAIVNRLVK